MQKTLHFLSVLPNPMCVCARCVFGVQECRILLVRAMCTPTAIMTYVEHDFAALAR